MCKLCDTLNVLQRFLRQTKHEIKLHSAVSALKGSATGTHYLLFGDVFVYDVTQTLSACFWSKGQTAFSYGLYFLQKLFTEIVYSQRRQ